MSPQHTHSTQPAFTSWATICLPAKHHWEFRMAFHWPADSGLAQGYKTFFVLNSTEHEIETQLIKSKIQTNEEVSCFNP